MLYLTCLYKNRKKDMKIEDLIKKLMPKVSCKNNLSKMDVENFSKKVASRVVGQVKKSIVERTLQKIKTTAVDN